MTADEWTNGANKDPIRMSMDPEKRSDNDNNNAKFIVKKSYEQLESENKLLRQRVAELEAQLGIPSTLNDDEKEDDPDTTMSSIDNNNNNGNGNENENGDGAQDE